MLGVGETPLRVCGVLAVISPHKKQLLATYVCRVLCSMPLPSDPACPRRISCCYSTTPSWPISDAHTCVHSAEDACIPQDAHIPHFFSGADLCSSSPFPDTVLLLHAFGLDISSQPEFDAEYIWLICHVLDEFALGLGGEQLFIYSDVGTGLRTNDAVLLQVADIRVNLSSCSHTRQASFLSKRRNSMISLKLFLAIISLKSGKPHFSDHKLSNSGYLCSTDGRIQKGYESFQFSHCQVPWIVATALMCLSHSALCNVLEHDVIKETQKGCVASSIFLFAYAVGPPASVRTLWLCLLPGCSSGWTTVHTVPSLPFSTAASGQDDSSGGLSTPTGSGAGAGFGRFIIMIIIG